MCNIYEMYKYIERGTKLLNELTKKIHVVTTTFALHAIFRRQLTLYKALQTFNKTVEYFLHRMTLTNKAIN